MIWNNINNKNLYLHSPWGEKNDGKKDSSRKKENDKPIEKKFTIDIKNFFKNIKNVIKKKCSLYFNKKTMHPISFIIVMILVSFFVSGFYSIKESEIGVVTHFGKFSHLVKPGLNWRAAFISSVDTVNVGTVREVSSSEMMLTAEENIINIAVNVQYKVTNPVDYLFSSSHPDTGLRQATESSIRNVIGHCTLDYILTSERSTLSKKIQKYIEGIIHPYKMGFTILDVNIHAINLPKKIKASFDDFIVARENRKQTIRAAKIYANTVQENAKRQAKKILREAQINSEKSIIEAQGKIRYFSKILPAYRKFKSLTLNYMYLQSMEMLLQKNKKNVVVENNSLILLRLLHSLHHNVFQRDKNVKKNSFLNKSHNFYKKNINCPLVLSSKNMLDMCDIISDRNNTKNLETK